MAAPAPQRLVAGVDFYVEGGKLVFTATYHLKRGYCCNSRCRHCPYGTGATAVSPTVRIVGLGAPKGPREP